MSGKKLFICSAAGDDSSVPIQLFILENHSDTIIEGIKKRIKESGADKAILYIPQSSGAAEKLRALGETIELIAGKDSLVCRDNTALLCAIKGEYIRPYYVPDENALLLEDNEITEIISVSAMFTALTGTKIFRVFGAVEREGFITVPIGASVKDIIDAAGGFKKDFPVKVVLAGGTQGRFIKPDEINSTAAHDDAIFSGAIEVFDDTICCAEIVRRAMNSCREISCGKCPLCREGAYQLASAFNDITNGKAKAETLSIVKEMSENIALGAFCQFGKNMAAFIVSAFDTVGEEISDHVMRKKCPASVCKAFMTPAILPEKCTGCMECLDACDEDAIEGKKGFIHMIQNDDCTKCGKCVKVCGEKAIVFVSGSKPRLPKRLTKVGQFA